MLAILRCVESFHGEMASWGNGYFLSFLIFYSLARSGFPIAN